jgi:hypothetical protein
MNDHDMRETTHFIRKNRCANAVKHISSSDRYNETLKI